MIPSPDRPIAHLNPQGKGNEPLPIPPDMDWPSFWQQLQKRLLHNGYRTGTLRLYRQVLRDLRAFLRDRYSVATPGGLTLAIAEDYLVFLSQKNVSWSWLASVISVLRNSFDRLGGMQVTSRMVTPRRTWPLPETLSERELRLLINVLPNPRDRLLVALLAGCGLRVSEACRIRWADFDRAANTLCLDDPSDLRSRTVSVPKGLLPLFQGLSVLSPASNPMICGRRVAISQTNPLSPRQAERVIQTAGRLAGLLKRTSPTILRSTYAQRRLIAGDTIITVQEALGHHSVTTTLRYQAGILPNVTSPADPESKLLLFRQASTLLSRIAVILPKLQILSLTSAEAIPAPWGDVTRAPYFDLNSHVLCAVPQGP